MIQLSKSSKCAKVAAGCILLSVGLFPTYAQENAEPAPVEPGPLLKLEIDHNQSLPGEPVHAILTFENPREEVLTWVNPILGFKQNTRLSFRKEQTPKFRDISLPAGIWHHAQPRRGWHLPAKSTALIEADLSYAENFPLQPGIYRLVANYQSVSLDPGTSAAVDRARISIWEGRAVSNEVTWQILPLPAEETKPFNLLKLEKWKENSRPYTLYASEAAETVLRQYPESRYAEYCLFYLGQKYSQERKQKGLTYLQRFVKENPKSRLADDALFYIARFKSSTGKRAEAKAPLERIVKEYPGSSKYDDAWLRVETILRDTEVELARSLAKAYCLRFEGLIEKVDELDNPPLSGPPTITKRNNRDIATYLWAGGGRYGYVVQVEIYQDDGQVMVSGAYRRRHFGRWVFKAEEETLEEIEEGIK